MAKNPSVFVRTDEKPNFMNTEALATGAAKGALFGSIIPGIGTLTGAAVGAAVNSVVSFGQQQQEQKTGKEYKAPTIFNREALLTAGTVVLGGAIATVTGIATGGIGFLPSIGAIAATFVAGKFGEGRMEQEYVQAKQQQGLEQLKTIQSMQAGNRVAGFDQGMGGMNTVSSEDYARMQEAQQNRGVHGKFTAAVQQSEQQQQQMGPAGVMR